jgi:hypothetical protein
MAVRLSALRAARALLPRKLFFKVANSSLDEVIVFFSIDLILPATLRPGVYSASNRNEYQGIMAEVLKNAILIQLKLVNLYHTKQQ